MQEAWLKSWFVGVGILLRRSETATKGKEGPNTFGSSAAPPPLVTEQSIISPSGRHGEICEFTHDQHTCSKPQITVNVNAMDTQSFLDRSEDIASAVRDAMLHMHPVNDVIGEL